MPSQVVNVVFGALAGQTLREALQSGGRQEDILTFPDDLSFGPINPVDGPLRLQWIRNNFHLSPEEWNIFPGELGAFFSRDKFEIFQGCLLGVPEFRMQVLRIL